MPDAATTSVAHLLALKAVPPFSSLPPDDLALLVERARPRSFATDDLLVAAGTPLCAIHLVLSGALEERRDGQRWAVREPYELVGGVDALANAGDRMIVRAMQPSETLELGRDDLLEVCQDRFDVLATVTAGVAAMAISARRRLGPTAGFPDVAEGPTATLRKQPDVADIVARLQAIAPLGGTPIHTLAYAANEGTVIALEPHEPLWEAGDPSDHVVLVLSGRVDCVSDDGRQRFALGPDDAAGLLDGLALAPRWYAATAATALVGLRMRMGALLDVLEDDPETAVGALVRFARATVGLVDEVVRRRPSV